MTWGRTLENVLKSKGISKDLDEWIAIAKDRSKWRQLTHSIPSYAKNVIARAAAQAKCAQFNGGSSCSEASVEAFLKHEMFSGGSVPKFEKSQGKKPTSVNHTAATSSTAASGLSLATLRTNWCPW